MVIKHCFLGVFFFQGVVETELRTKISVIGSSNLNLTATECIPTVNVTEH